MTAGLLRRYSRAFLVLCAIWLALAVIWHLGVPSHWHDAMAWGCAALSASCAFVSRLYARRARQLERRATP